MSVFDFIHLIHGARGGESQTNRMCIQVSVSMSVLSVFVLSVFVTAFVCLSTVLKVHPLTSSIFSLLHVWQVSRSDPAFKNVVQVLARWSTSRLKDDGYHLQVVVALLTLLGARGGVSTRSCSKRKTAFDNKLKTKGPWPPVSIVYWKLCFNLKEGGRFWKSGGKTLTWVVCNKGLQDALLRGPKTFVLCNKKSSYSVLWSVLGVARS